MSPLRRTLPWTACALIAIGGLTAGCVDSTEHRLNVASSRDETRRAEFEHCRDQGRSDCDRILNAPVNSNTPPSTDHGDAVRRQEAREAYDRCKERNGTDCDDLLHR
jgi:hypothetical protein